MEANVWILVVLWMGLGIAVLTDMTMNRIPNWLTLSVAIMFLMLQFLFGGWTYLLLAVGGLLVGLLCFVPSYLFGAMGAGDVKLMAAVGAALGPWYAFVAALMSVIAGGAIAMVYIAWKGGARAMLRRYGCMILLMSQGQPCYLPPMEGEAAALRIPYALAIACGTAMSVWFLAVQNGSSM